MGLIYQGNTGYGKQFLYRQEFPICKRITILREQGRLVGGIVIIPITFDFSIVSGYLCIQ